LGSLGVDATTSDVVYQRQGDAVITETGVTAEFDVWNHFALLFDFGLHNYSVFFNGANLAKTGFVGLGPGGAQLERITDADISAVSAGAESVSQLMTGTAYFDNFRVLDGIPGDFDDDGDVDNLDLTVWRNNVGATSDAGDADGDGDTDGGDFLVWQQNVGTDLVAGAVPSIGAVPEPASGVLVATACLWWLGARRRRACR
jgi:hypothetical protein